MKLESGAERCEIFSGLAPTQGRLLSTYSGLKDAPWDVWQRKLPGERAQRAIIYYTATRHDNAIVTLK